MNLWRRIVRRQRARLRLLGKVLPAPGRRQRYLAHALPVFAAIWGISLFWLVAAPRVYRSEFTLILPGSGAGGTLNLESIGQAQSTTASAFSSPTLSPTENYKQLLLADVTLRGASEELHQPPDHFPAPTVKLVDQTNLIMVDITGHSAAEAHDRAMALSDAFLRELDRLRNDEATKRQASDVAYLGELSAKVLAAQRRLIAFQAEHGLATLEQFNARITAVDTLRDKERDLRITWQQQLAATTRLSGSLAIDPHRANIVMRLRGDPIFQELAQKYAALNADAATKAATLGPRHVSMVQVTAERNAVRKALLQRGHELTAISGGDLLRAVDVTVADGRSNLMQAMAVDDAQAAGSHAALVALDRDLAHAAERAPELIAQASELAELQRDHRVAEAVFTSALARVDTNKQDPFASYPLVQVLAPPSQPSRPAFPSLTLAIAGGVGASLFTLLGFTLLWLRRPLLRKILPNG